MTRPARLKLLRVIARLNVGGPARQAILLHDELRALGFDTVLVHGVVGPGEASLEHLLEERTLDSVQLPGLGAEVHPLRDVQSLLQLVRVLFAERPDILHTHTAKAGAIGRLAAFAYNLTRARHRRCLVVHTFHGNVLQGYFGPAASWAVRVAERALARVTDRIVTISPGQRMEIVERFRIAPSRRVSIVRLGLDLDEFLCIGPVDPALRVELRLPRDSIVLGTVGRLVPIKDHATLLRAMALARETAPGLHLVVVGDGRERRALEDLAAALGIAQEVRFLGWRHDLAHIYSGLDIVTLSSRNEGTPVALIEAMAAGRPVVATDVGGVSDLVSHGKNGLVVGPGDPRQLADAILELAAGSQRRAELGTMGRASVAPYRKSCLLTALPALYREELAQRRGQPVAIEHRAGTRTSG